MGRYLEISRQISHIESSKAILRAVPDSGYDKTDINDKRSYQRPVLPNDRSQWSADDWRTHFDERAAITEHEGGWDRSAAEGQAFECAVVEWLNAHPEPEGDDDICAQCQNRLTDTDMLPVLNGPGGHVWLHSYCHQPFMDQRRAIAISELEAMGLVDLYRG